MTGTEIVVNLLAIYGAISLSHLVITTAGSIKKKLE